MAASWQLEGRERHSRKLRRRSALAAQPRQCRHAASLRPPRGTDSRWPDQLAAIDMGSNSFRLEIGQIQRGRYRRIDYLKETVRLGAGLDADGLLTEEAATRGLDCLARFARRLDGFAPRQVRAVATQTLREARNRDAFLLRAQTGLGQPIEVISGPRGGAPHLRRRRAAAAVDSVPRLVDRHRRPLDRDDPRPRHAAAPRPSRSRSAASACRCKYFRRRPLHRARASARRRSPPAPSSRKRSSRSRRATGARRWARRARSARCRSCSPPAASPTAASRRTACAG